MHLLQLSLWFFFKIRKMIVFHYLLMYFSQRNPYPFIYTRPEKKKKHSFRAEALPPPPGVIDF